MSAQGRTDARTVFVTGGARSGKSSFAMREAALAGVRKLYIATAEPLDEEMSDRIARHRKERGDDWDTVEEPLLIDRILRDMGGKFDAIVLDCLTLWVSNMMHRGEDVAGRTGQLIDVLKDRHERPGHVFIVSNEIGMGIVPDNELARRYRDCAGLVNQRIAGAADEAYLVTSGIPVRIK